MPRAAGVRPSLILPSPPPQYDVQDQREVRRIIEHFGKQLPDWNTVASVPTPVTAIGALTGAPDTVPYFTAISAMALASLTPYARTILAAASASDARTLLGLGSIALLNTIAESNVMLADVTTLNVSTAKHGLAPKLPGSAAVYLDGSGNYSTPSSASATPGWVTDAPQTKPASPNAANDYFGGADYPSEAALDTAGSRFTGATGWQWRNQGTSTASVGGGRLLLVPQVNGQHHGVEQAVPGGTWRYQGLITGKVDQLTNTVETVMYVANNATGRALVGGLVVISTGQLGLHASVWNNLTSWSADRKNPAPYDACQSWTGWIEVEYDGTNLIFRSSPTGLPGSFSIFWKETVAGWVVTPTHIGLSCLASSNAAALVCDAWQRAA